MFTYKNGLRFRREPCITSYFKRGYMLNGVQFLTEKVEVTVVGKSSQNVIFIINLKIKILKIIFI